VPGGGKGMWGQCGGRSTIGTPIGSLGGWRGLPFPGNGKGSGAPRRS
jgi:hypothetical protein